MPAKDITVGRRFIAARQAGAAVEFAISGVALFAFLLAIINLGDLGLTLGILEHGVQATAREATVQVTANLAASSPTTCPTNTNIQSYFNNFTVPPLPSGTGGGPVINAKWINSGTGLDLNLNVTYLWKPIGFSSLFGNGIALGITTVATAIGTSGLTTTC